MHCRKDPVEKKAEISQPISQRSTLALHNMGHIVLSNPQNSKKAIKPYNHP